jgi:hypothetical protein
MGDALRRVFLSIGIALGLAEGRPDPVLYARVIRDQGYIVVNARVEGAFVPEALELVQTGSRVALRFGAELAAKQGALASASSTRSVCYDLRASAYRIEIAEEGKSSSVIDPVTATGLVSTVQALRLYPTGDLAAGGRIAVAVSVSVGIIDSSGSWREAPVLWNYSALRSDFSFDSPDEVPGQ